MRRFLFLGCTVTLLALGLTGWLTAQAMPGGITFDIRAGTATTSLKEFATQAHLQLLFDYKAVENLKTPAVHGQLAPTEALKELLEGSGFRFREINDHTIAITRPAASTSSTGMQQETPSDTEAAREGRANSSAGFLLAQATSGQTAGASSVEQSGAQSPEKGVLQEVIVTAEKRAERLQDVPVPVTAIDAQALVDQGQTRLADYYTSIPGLAAVPDGEGGSTFQIRGLSSGAGNPTVAVTVDDVPYGTSTSWGNSQVPDIDPSDLARIEVLRGPQGTLYGASSIGGILKYVTIDPSTDAISGQVQGGVESVYHGAEVGYSVRGSINLPVSDTLAIRASAFDREDPGYVDNVLTGQDGIDEAQVRGGRLAALWRPSEDLSLKLTALVQHNTATGVPEVETETGSGTPLQGLEQSVPRGAGAYDRTRQVYSATLNEKLGNAELTAISGYSRDRNASSLDYTAFFGGYANADFPVPGTVLGTILPITYTTDRFTQEIRLSVPIQEKVNALFGVYYDHESTSLVDRFVAVVPSTGAQVGDLIEYIAPSTFAEYAAFTNLTFTVTDSFDIQAGGREGKNKQMLNDYATAGPLVSSFEPNQTFTPTHTEDSAFTYLITPRLKLSPDVMVYARLASGYRTGGPNNNQVLPGIPPHFEPDKTENYEVGLKGEFLDHRLSVDSSVYYTDWKNLQITLAYPGNYFPYTSNAARAKTEGVEFSIESKPTGGLTIAAWFALGTAALTEPLPASSTAYGASGDRLPFSSRISANLSAEQSFALTSTASGFIAGEVAYQGDHLGNFQGSASVPRQYYPGYAKVDLRAGVKCSAWTISLFVNNIADRRALVLGGVDNALDYSYFYIQPRTGGLSLARDF